MSFVARHNIFGMNDLRISHTRFRDDVTLEPEAVEIMQDMRDDFARKIDEVCQWLFRQGNGFERVAGCDIAPLAAAADIKQRIEEQFLAPIDARIEELRDAAPPVVASRPGLHGAPA